MKTFLLFILSLAFVHQKADPLNPIDEVSSVKFIVKNFGFAVTGGFKGLTGAIKFDPNDLPNSSFDVNIDANTINTGIDMRDEHLRGESYFDVKNYPRIHFVSTRVTGSNKAGTFFVFGKLTIKETTKEISFPFNAQPQTDGYSFKGEFKLNRRDYHIGGSGTISNDVVVKLEVVAKK
jgi:polyisoprenoid-binding protein YceI